MFISRLRYQSQRPERAAGTRFAQPDDAAVGGVHGAQPCPGKGIKGLAVAETRLLRGIELGARQTGEQRGEGKQVLRPGR